MNDSDRAHFLATAIEAARRAYRALADQAGLPPDRELARSSDYQALLHAGVQLRNLCGPDLFQQAKAQLYSDDPALSARAARDLDHLWAGLQDWPGEQRSPRLH